MSGKSLSSLAAQSLPLAKGPAAHSRVAKLALYKECILLANTVREKHSREIALAEIKTKWREQKGHGGMTLQVSLASALDRIAYLRMCTSKTAQRGIPRPSETYDWEVHNPMENQEKLQMKRREEMHPEIKEECHGRGRHRDFVPVSNWDSYHNNADPDMVKKHKELLDKQYLMHPTQRGKPKPLVYEDLSFEEQLQAHFAPPPIAPSKPRKKY